MKLWLISSGCEFWSNNTVIFPAIDEIVHDANDADNFFFRAFIFSGVEIDKPQPNVESSLGFDYLFESFFVQAEQFGNFYLFFLFDSISDHFKGHSDNWKKSIFEFWRGEDWSLCGVGVLKDWSDVSKILIAWIWF